MAKQKIIKRRNIVPDSTFHTGATFMLELAKDSEEGRFYKVIAAILFTAFEIESCLNLVGKLEILSWDLIEKKLSPKEKLKLLSKQLSLNIDYGKSPFQDFDNIFQFRNDVVHAKTETKEETTIVESNSYDEEKLALTRWEKQVTITTAEGYIESAKEICLSIINSSKKLHEDPLKGMNHTHTERTWVD